MSDKNERRLRDTAEALRIVEELRALARRVEQYDRFAASLLRADIELSLEQWADAHPYDEDGNRLEPQATQEQALQDHGTEEGSDHE